MKILTESGLSRLWAIINSKFNIVNSEIIELNNQIDGVEPTAPIPESNITEIIGETTVVSAEAISI